MSHNAEGNTARSQGSRFSSKALWMVIGVESEWLHQVERIPSLFSWIIFFKLFLGSIIHTQMHISYVLSLIQFWELDTQESSYILYSTLLNFSVNCGVGFACKAKQHKRISEYLLWKQFFLSSSSLSWLALQPHLRLILTPTFADYSSASLSVLSVLGHTFW